MTAKWKTQNSRNPYQRSVPKKPANEFVKYGLTCKMLNRGNANAPTILCIGSKKAKFTFEYQMSPDAGKEERDAVLHLASSKAAEFATAYSLFESVYADVPWECQLPLVIGETEKVQNIFFGDFFRNKSIKESSGWELHAEQSRESVATRMSAWDMAESMSQSEIKPIEKTLLACVFDWAEKQANFLKDSTLVGLNEALQDPTKFVLNSEAKKTAHSNLATAFDGIREGKKTGIRVWVDWVDGYKSQPGTIVGTMAAFDLDDENGESEGLSVLSGFIIGSTDGNPFLQVHHARARNIIRAYTPSNLKFTPEELGMTTEAAEMLLGLNMPIAMGMPRFKQATESFDIDFSEVLADEISMSLF